jgi:4Fe-4S iron-sulfur cluster binding domain/DR2241 stabilising domain
MTTDCLHQLIQQGYRTIGELEFTRLELDSNPTDVDCPSTSGYRLYHAEDRNSLAGLRVCRQVTDARRLAKFDCHGRYRPLKGAPDLQRGWVLELKDLASLHQAIDEFYPGALGMFIALQRGEIRRTPFRATVDRQSGMYRITQKIRTDEAEELVRAECRSDRKCLRTILWPIEPGQALNFLPDSKFDPLFDQTGAKRRTIPFLCLEPCNLLVAAARTVVKKRIK